MNLDIDRRARLGLLLDLYSGLLTEHQRETLRLHLEQDWSFAEIAEFQGVSRAAAHDSVRRTEAALEDYELKLGLLARGESREQVRETLAARVEDLEAELRSLKKAVKEIA
jgi:predicted DNA-binding protein YlxM (UPF0122 family)